MSDPRGFEVVIKQKLPNNGYFIRVKVTDRTVTLRSIYQSLIDASWINHFFPKGDWMTASVTARTIPTIQRIASDFDNGINPVVNRDTGEKLVFSKKGIRNSQSNMQTASISSQNRTKIQSLQN